MSDAISGWVIALIVTFSLLAVLVASLIVVFALFPRRRPLPAPSDGKPRNGQ